MKQPLMWEPEDADLVAYLLDDLGGARAEYVAAHLSACPECRARLAELEGTLARLNAMPRPDGDSSQQMHVLKARIQVEATNRDRKPNVILQSARIGLAVVAMLVLAITIGPTLTNAGDGALRKLVGTDAELGTAPREPNPDPAARQLATVDPALLPDRRAIDIAELPYAPIAPESLPGTNQKVHAEAFDTGLFRAFYEGSDGLQLELRQEPASTNGVRLSESLATEKIQIRDTEAIIAYNATLNTVDLVFWERGGMFFSLSAVNYAINDFPRAEALQVVERLMELQDNPES